MIAILLLLAFDVARLWHVPMARVASARGTRQFAAKDYAAAARSFADANQLDPSPQNAFNLGTAQIAAGDREAGSRALRAAMADPNLRADALYNRGTSALAAKSYDAAIRDYADVLRIHPSDGAAKRNLEIALKRKEAAESARGQQHGMSGAQPQPKPNAPQGGAAQAKPKSDPNLDALLRSVQEQEKEELQRMRRPRGEPSHVGW